MFSAVTYSHARHTCMNSERRLFEDWEKYAFIRRQRGLQSNHRISEQHKHLILVGVMWLLRYIFALVSPLLAIRYLSILSCIVVRWQSCERCDSNKCRNLTSCLCCWCWRYCDSFCFYHAITSSGICNLRPCLSLQRPQWINCYQVHAGNVCKFYLEYFSIFRCT